jgi:hypothetical protein
MRLTRSARASAAPALLACLALALMAVPALAHVQTKSCTRIGGCTTVLRPPVIVTATQTPRPVSHFGVTVKTAPTSTLGTASQPGKLVTNQLLANEITCKGYTERSDTTLAFMLRTATPLNITYVVTDRLTNTKPDGIHVCLASPLPFKTLSGAPAAPIRLPDGSAGHIGLLPGCAKVPDTAPCLVSATPTPDPNSSTGVDVLTRVRVPARTKGDPWIRP